MARLAARLGRYSRYRKPDIKAQGHDEGLAYGKDEAEGGVYKDLYWCSGTPSYLIAIWRWMVDRSGTFCQLYCTCTRALAGYEGCCWLQNDMTVRDFTESHRIRHATASCLDLL